jgi:DNA polymerase III alpha subunit
MDVAEQHKIFEHLEEKYKEAFCRISVDSQLKLKSSIKDAERAILGKVRPETERLCIGLPNPPQSVSDYDFAFGYEEDGVKHPGLIEIHQGLKKYVEQNPEIWQTVEEMLGIIRQKSQHACGVVISDKPVHEYIPITYIGEAKVTGFSPKQLESAGLIKFDVLGLNTLKDIQDALKLIKQQHGIKIDPFSLPYSAEVFAAVGNGDTVTTFQFDTETVRPYLRATKPSSIDDLAAITSLCRPGTLDAPSGEYDGDREMSLAEVYVARAQGRPIKYIHKDLEPIMKETLGVQLYQEQTLRIFRDIANYTYEQAETVRRGIGKKDKKVLESCMGDLRKACVDKGWTDEQVDLLIEQIMASSRYAFNKSHAISYAYVAYACMYLRLHYPLEWWTAILSNASKDDLKKYWTHAVQWIKMPEINSSDQDFYIRTEGGRRFIQAPITLLDGVGPATTQEISIKKPFKDFDDFFKRVDRRIINKRIMFKFILGGLLDQLFPPGITDLDKIKTYLKLKQKVEGGKGEDIPEELMNLSPLQQLRHKRSIFTVYKLDWTETAAPYLEKRKVIERMGRIYKYLDSNSKELNGKPLLNSSLLKRRLDPSDFSQEIFAFVGYVSDTEDITYNRKQFDQATGKTNLVPNTMRKFVVEMGDLTLELIKWPDWGSNDHGIEKDFNEKVALFVIQRKVHPDKGLQLTIKKVLDISNIDQ